MVTKRVSKPADPPPSAETSGDEFPDPTIGIDDLASVMAGLAGATTSRITVYRQVKNRPLAYVCECTPDSFSLDDLRDKYNGGDFRLYISKNGVLWKNMRISVEPQQSQAAPETAPAAVDELAAVMREGFARQSELMARLARGSAEGAAPNLLSGIDLPATITAVAAAITALRPPPPPPPPPQAQVSSNQAIDMLLKGIDLARELKSEAAGEGEGGLLGVVKDMLKSPLLGNVVTAMQAPPQRIQAPRPAAPTNPPPPALPPPPPPSFAGETAQDQSMSAKVQFYLSMLCGRAAANSDPTLYAEMVLDNVPDDQIMNLLIAPGGAVEALIAIHPAVADHREWFVQLIDVVRSAFEADPDSDAQSGQSPQLDPPHAPPSSASNVPQ